MGLFTATETNPATIQRDFAEILADDEEVLAAFNNIRDRVFLTNYRFVMVDVQGLTGRKVEVMSVPYKSITRFSVETAGTFDLDADMKIWVSSNPKPFEVKIGRGADVAGIQKAMATHICGRG